VCDKVCDTIEKERKKEMRPMIQLWLPFFPMSPFHGAAARDLQRIKKEWLCETFIYLSPDYKEVSRFEIRTGEKSRFIALIGIPTKLQT